MVSLMSGFVAALTGHEDRCGGCLSALDAFGMVVGHFRRPRRVDQNIVQRAEREADRRYPHGGAIAPAVVRIPAARAGPVPESNAVARIGICANVLVKRVDVVSAVQKTVGHGNRQDGVVRESGLGDKQFEVGRLGADELVHGADHVTGDRAQHCASRMAFLSAEDPQDQAGRGQKEHERRGTQAFDITDPQVPDNGADKVRHESDGCGDPQGWPNDTCQKTQGSGELTRCKNWKDLEGDTHHVVDDPGAPRVAANLHHAGRREHHGEHDGDGRVDDRGPRSRLLGVSAGDPSAGVGDVVVELLLVRSNTTNVT